MCVRHFPVSKPAQPSVNTFTSARCRGETAFTSENLCSGRRQKLKQKQRCRRRQPGWVAVTQPKVSGHKAHACPLMAKEISEAVLCKKKHKFFGTLFENFQRSAGARDRFCFYYKSWTCLENLLGTGLRAWPYLF